jgi:hypothetical protein
MLPFYIQVILSACSPFFRQILRRNPHQHPLLYLKVKMPLGISLRVRYGTELIRGPPELIQYFCLYIGKRALHVLYLIWFR